MVPARPWPTRQNLMSDVVEFLSPDCSSDFASAPSASSAMAEFLGFSRTVALSALFPFASAGGDTVRTCIASEPLPCATLAIYALRHHCGGDRPFVAGVDLVRVRTPNPKGGKAPIPEDLMVRQFPVAALDGGKREEWC